MINPPPNSFRQRVIICEGFHDRAFWAEWLVRHFSCSEERIDPWTKLPLRDGHFGFKTPTDGFIRVVPAKGDRTKETDIAVNFVADPHHPVSDVVLNFDRDFLGRTTLWKVGGLLKKISAVDPSAKATRDRLDLRGVQTCFQMAVWDVPRDDVEIGVPSQQTLERVICTALARAYPKRAEVVQRWLDSRPAKPKSTAANTKAYTWSYMAGWNAANGCEDFLRHVWRDGHITKRLQDVLTEIGVWTIGSEIAR